MSTIEEVQNQVVTLTSDLEAANAALIAMDSKLDEIRTFIGSLVGPVTQEQLDALGATLDAAKAFALTAKTGAETVLAEADALDE